MTTDQPDIYEQRAIEALMSDDAIATSFARSGFVDTSAVGVLISGSRPIDGALAYLRSLFREWLIRYRQDEIAKKATLMRLREALDELRDAQPTTTEESTP